jgi:ADP-ribose pyrophosphatase YjhB (NUDIX family)
VSRTEFYHHVSAPEPTVIRPTAFAVVRDADRVLLAQRCDDGLWELPGGGVDLGESAVDAVVREVAEETGVTIKVTGVAGVYSDPAHRQEYAGGEVRQVLALCFHAWPLDGRPRPDGVETRAAAWVEPDRIADLPMHPAMRLRLAQALGQPDITHLG